MRRRLTLLLSGSAVLSLVGCPTVPPPNLWTETDKVCLDHWSLAHFGSGVLLALATGDGGAVPTTAVLVGWEAIEPTILPGETPANQICDLAVGLGGWGTVHAVAD